MGPAVWNSEEQRRHPETMVFFNCLITPAVLCGCTGLVQLELGRWEQPE